VSDFLYVRGDFGFDHQRDGDHRRHQPALTLDVTAVTIGAENLTAFAGVNGPLLLRHTGDGSSTPATPSASATGLSLNGVDFALALLRPATPATGDSRHWSALKASADDVRFVGFNDFKADLRNVIMESTSWRTSSSGPNTQIVNFSRRGAGGLRCRPAARMQSKSISAITPGGRQRTWI
jgi:hypothetical protein